MSEAYELEAEIRQETGKGAMRRMRRDSNKIPAIIYGSNQNPQPITLDHNKVIRAIENEGFYSRILTVTVDGKKEKAVLKDIQRHPFKPKVLHMDFQRISEKEKIHMHIPLHFNGEDLNPAVKKGAIISHMETGVDISCLPADLPEYIEVDVANLGLDESLHLSDLVIPKGVELVDLTHGNDKAVVSIHIPRAIVEAEEIPVAEEVPVTTAEGVEPATGKEKTE